MWKACFDADERVEGAEEVSEIGVVVLLSAMTGERVMFSMAGGGWMEVVAGAEGGSAAVAMMAWISGGFGKGRVTGFVLVAVYGGGSGSLWGIVVAARLGQRCKRA